MTQKASIVLVHGALTDASVWNRVAARLHADGLATIAPAMPLRGLASDAEYLAAFLASLEGGPLVLAGHSYGGSVISHPAVASDKVKALVFVAAFAPDEGETTSDLNGRWPGSKLGEATAVIRPYPGGQDLYLRPDAFQDVYAGDLDHGTVALMAAAQRPIATTALGETFSGRPTWRTVPSWAVVSTNDNSLPVEAQRFMAQRANATAKEVGASHASPLSQPAAVADVMVAAAQVSASNKAVSAPMFLAPTSAHQSCETDE